jgi:hypothetical protein
MNKYEKALDVLLRSREEVINELARTGESGGTGLAQRYAPILVNLQDAIEATQKLIEPKESKEEFGARMAAARANAKAAKAAQ